MEGVLPLSTTRQDILFTFSETTLASEHPQARVGKLPTALCRRSGSEQDRTLLVPVTCSLTVLSAYLLIPSSLRFGQPTVNGLL